ncbi:MAG: PAS domain S-box protein [Methanoregula sp.]|nr:PAS domain S-box protein [Methanoregula sp.]
MDAKKNLADSPDLKRQEPEDRSTVFTEEIRQGLLKMGIRKKLCLLLIPFSLVLIALLVALNNTTVYEVPLVLPVTNTLFIGVISIGIAYITTRVYTRSGTASVFLMGSGILIFGLGAITAGWLILLPGGPNINVTIYNTCAFIGSLFILTGAAISCLTPVQRRGRGSTWKGAAIYTGILVFVTLFCMATVKGLVPPFFIPGIGFTELRQVLLENAIVFYAIASVLFLYTYLKGRTDFFFWYSISFAFMSIGLFAFFIQPTVGCLIGWVGRSANYLGFGFALYAVYIAQRVATAKDLPLEEIIANFFVDAEESYKQLVETATDAIITFDENYRILLWNAAAERMFGYRRDEVFGLSFPELVIDERYIAVIKNEEGDFPADRTQPRAPVSVEILGKRKDGTLIPVELTISRRFQEGRLIRTCILRDLTERKRAEEALSMTLVMDGVPTQLSYVDADLHFVYVNKAYAEWYGKTIEDLKGKSIRDVEGEKEFLHALPHYKMVLLGKPVSFENITHDTEGKEYFEIVTLVPHYKGEQVTGFFASIMDITKRKQAEEALLQLTERLSLATRAGGVGVWDYDVINNTLNWDDQMFALYGIQPEQFSGAYEAWQAGLHPEDRKRGDAEIQMALGGEKEFDTEFRVLWSDGSIHTLRALAVVQRDASGKPLRMIGTNWDITERKQAEDALRESEHEFRSLAEAMPQIVWVTRADGWNIYFNQQWVDYTGLSLEESYGHGWNTPFHPDDQQRASDAWQQDTASGGTYSLECRLRRADGVYQWWLIRGVPLRNASGEILKWFGTCTNIEDLKQAEEDLRKLNLELEERVIDRTRELSDANERLKELDRLKSMFIASMSHELRTPLNSIIGFTGIMVKGKTGAINPEQKKQLSMVQDSARHLLALINDVIDISKIEAGKIDASISTFDLARVIRDVQNTFAPQAAEQGLALNIQIPESISVTSDDRRITQIIMNLVNNAIKFTDAGSVDLTVQKRGAFVEVRVRDTGIGITGEDIQKLFHPFVRVQVPGRLTEGTGLGLYLSQKLARFLGGEITVESEPATGSVFMFLFPVVYEKQEEDI